MRRTTEDNGNGIQWVVFTQLDDLDFLDDLAVLSNRHAQTHNKTTTLGDSSNPIGLHFQGGKTKIIRSNIANTDPIVLRDLPLKDVQSILGA